MLNIQRECIKKSEINALHTCWQCTRANFS